MFSRWNAVALVPIAAMFLCGSIVFNNQTSGEPQDNKDSPSKKSSDVSKQVIASPTAARSKALIIPALREQRAAAGRGKALVYALDQNGDRIALPPVPSKRRKRRGGGVLLESPSKEVIVDLPCAVVTGVVDHHLVAKQSFSSDGEFRTIAREHLYRRVDLERQERSHNNEWSDWRPVDSEPTVRIIDNLPEVDYERTPDEIRTFRLVDPLPYLKEGVWTGVDVDRFVPKLKENKVDREPGNFGGLANSRRATPPVLMVRQFDFTIEPGKTYRYRAAGWSSRTIGGVGKKSAAPGVSLRSR